MSQSRTKRSGPGLFTLNAVGSGTAMASVCVIGLLQMQQLVGGIWSLVAVGIAACLCSIVAAALARMAQKLPTGAGLLAYTAKALGRRFAVLLIVSYMLLLLFMVGVEALVIGIMIAHVTPVPALVGALAFVFVTWVICRRGINLGYRIQTLATVSLFICLVTLSMLAVVSAAIDGNLDSKLLTSSPSIAAMGAAVGQAVFLFMGFELVTSHAEVASSANVSRALRLSVLTLTVFYGVVSLGMSCLEELPALTGDNLVVPQLALADNANHPAVMPITVVVCLMASFSSFNGALLGIALFTRALARQGALPKRLSKVDPKTMTATTALNAILCASVMFTIAVHLLSIYQAAILTAAVVAAFVYGAACWTREQKPFREPNRPGWMRIVGALFALVFIGLGSGVIIDAGDARWPVLALLATAIGAATVAMFRIRLPRSAARTT